MHAYMYICRERESARARATERSEVCGGPIGAYEHVCMHVFMY